MLKLLPLHLTSVYSFAASVLAFAGAVDCATAATLSPLVIRSCLAAPGVAADVSVTELPTGEVYSEAAYRPGYDAAYLLPWKGGDVGLARDGATDALIAVGRLFPLGEATTLEDSGVPQRFDPQLASWLNVAQGRSRYLCVSFNFSGLGQSGRFQQVRGGYVLPLQSRDSGQTLYYVVGNVSPDLDE